MGGIDRSAVYYNFAGRVTKTVTTHFEGEAQRQVQITERSDYDHTGRVVAAYHQINEQPEVQLASWKYNELNEVIEKNLHVTADGALQSIDYRNNIRGWLNTINNTQLTSSENNDDEGDYFGMELNYHDITDQNDTPLYNGMITSATWSNAMDTVAQRRYVYAYDKSYRLRSATHYEENGGWLQTNHYSESQQYDANGNITNLTRTDGKGNSQDILQYTYNGNQLTRVTDSGDAVKGFKDGNTTGDDYAYDANGFLAKDKNLGIDTIYYYHFNKPDSLVFSNGTRIKYVYDASGGKLAQKIYSQHNLVNTRNYIGEFTYADTTLELIHHAEGRLTRSKVTTGEWAYEYDITDYLGNVRVTFTSEPYTETFTATMEDQSASEEEAQFMRVEDLRASSSTAIDHTKTSDTPNVVRLNGYHQVKEGPGKGLRVMPGDKVRMEVYVKYLDMRRADPRMAAATILSMLATGGAARTPGDPGQVMTATSDAPGGLPGLLGDTEDLEAPKAFLNYYLFDSQFTQIDAGFTQVTKAAAINAEDAKGKHEKLVMEIEIKKAGYLFTNLSQDGDENVDVYFDDFTVIHEHGNIVQVQDYYPYGTPFNGKIKEHAVLNKYLYQGKELQDSTGWYDFHARQYSSELGRFLGVDPASQFASPFSAMGNNPVMAIDPDGKLAWFVPIIIGAVIGGTTQGIAAEQNGGNFFDGFWRGAVVGAAAGATGIGATTALGSSFMGGIAAGAVGGGLGAAINGGNVGAGIWQGALGGGIGTIVGMNVPGILSGALVGGATGGLASGITAELTGGNFGDAFLNGAISGAISGGIYGGISASQSKYQRNILFGGVTRQGKMQFVNEFLAAAGAYNNGLEQLIIKNDLPENRNASTTPLVNGNEVTLPEAYGVIGGTKSNLYLKIAGKSLRAIGSTLSHELTHVSDLFSGYANRYYTSNGQNLVKTTLHLEIRGYTANIKYGYNTGTYLKMLIQAKGAFNIKY